MTAALLGSDVEAESLPERPALFRKQTAEAHSGLAPHLDLSRSTIPRTSLRRFVVRLVTDMALGCHDLIELWLVVLGVIAKSRHAFVASGHKLMGILFQRFERLFLLGNGKAQVSDDIAWRIKFHQRVVQLRLAEHLSASALPRYQIVQFSLNLTEPALQR